MKVDDEVITLISKIDIPKGTFGVIERIEGESAWVAVYIPADDDTPYDIVRYSIKDLQLQ